MATGKAQGPKLQHELNRPAGFGATQASGKPCGWCDCQEGQFFNLHRPHDFLLAPPTFDCTADRQSTGLEPPSPPPFRLDHVTDAGCCPSPALAILPRAIPRPTNTAAVLLLRTGLQPHPLEHLTLPYALTSVGRARPLPSSVITTTSPLHHCFYMDRAWPPSCQPLCPPFNTQPSSFLNSTPDSCTGPSVIQLFGRVSESFLVPPTCSHRESSALSIHPA